MAAKSLTDAECRDVLYAVEHHGSIAAAAIALGINYNTFKSRLRVANARAAELSLQGQAPGHFESGVAPGYQMGKVTIQRSADGSVERTWERQSPDQRAMADAMKIAAEAMAEDLPRMAPVPPPAHVVEDLCNMHSFFDYHIGMLAWHPEGGDDWDLGIAEDRLMRCYSMMLARCPAAHKAIVVLGGDWLHTDGLLPVTPAHRHILDADGRFSKMVQVAIRTMRFLINESLERHMEVEAVVMEGNHDEASSVWLRHMLTHLYEDEPRLTVNNSELPFYVTQWGDTMLGFHHGHKVKNEQLPLLFAAQFPQIWGSTSYREIHCGHRHHRDEKEYNGAMVVQHPTLAARDAFAARGGWIAKRAAQSITYSKLYGYAGRVVISPEMLG